MARPWIVLCFLTVATSASGFIDRLLDTREYMSPLPHIVEDSYRWNPRLHMLKRWKREVIETREPCAELTSPWMESTEQPAQRATLLRLRIRSFAQRGSRRVVFPGKSLFNFVRQAYRCCQEGFICRNVKGIQGHLREGAQAEFLLTPDVLSVPITRAELHLQMFNPRHLSIQPVLLFLAKRNLPTRYDVWAQGDMVELKVDLLSVFLMETAGGLGGGGASSLVDMLLLGMGSRGGPPEAAGQQAPLDTSDAHDGGVWGDGLSHRPPPPPLELGLALYCSHDGHSLPCQHAGLRLSHMPFIALSYP